ncbi:MULTISPECIES: 4-oxalocrotonate tautomerase [unclassified Variovorax]|uniref:4-oxalocrotonate tautomerase n=1 Tax=unclassified Variovorax TaxID=663243 RepID=UPI0025759C09|nr:MULTISPECIES: 4-oxalocrotonate tautomerase [unclassified Variovorax]MDM0066917.1 4-oxalocrotonate tautomerase [Variovorax sp. J31P207]MDM0084614.1 4-oxalocrotonate tautomerase [Variovorax sp. J31P179]
MPLIQVTLIEGRGAEAKTALIQGLTDAAVEAIAAPRDSVRVIIQEVPAAHWGVGGVPKGGTPAEEAHCG